MRIDVDKLLPLPTASFHILLSLVDGPTHGYGVKHEVEERTGGAVSLSAGTLYEAVQRLLRQGLVQKAEAPEKMEANPRWRFYDLTDAGSTVLAAELARLERDVAFARTKIPAAGSGR